jgi:thioredoxin-like negative regulator of GroEL
MIRYGRNEEAVALLMGYIETNSEWHLVKLQLAQAYIGFERYDEARQLLHQLAQSNHLL